MSPALAGACSPVFLERPAVVSVLAAPLRTAAGTSVLRTGKAAVIGELAAVSATFRVERDSSGRRHPGVGRNFRQSARRDRPAETARVAVSTRRLSPARDATVVTPRAREARWGSPRSNRSRERFPPRLRPTSLRDARPSGAETSFSRTSWCEVCVVSRFHHSSLDVPPGARIGLPSRHARGRTSRVAGRAAEPHAARLRQHGSRVAVSARNPCARASCSKPLLPAESEVPREPTKSNTALAVAP